MSITRIIGRIHLTVGVVYLCSGAKEIDIAATLEHIRDQRVNMVRTKVSQFVDIFCILIVNYLLLC